MLKSQHINRGTKREPICFHYANIWKVEQIENHLKFICHCSDKEKNMKQVVVAFLFLVCFFERVLSIPNTFTS